MTIWTCKDNSFNDCCVRLVIINVLFYNAVVGDDASESRELLKANYDGKSGFFYVELPDGTIMGHTIDENENFPVQFGREVFFNV